MDSFKLACGDKVNIAVDYGCNLFSWIVGGKDVLFTPEKFVETIDEFYHGGNPILFPSVGRTWDCSGPEPVQDIYQMFGLKTKHSMPIHGILTLTEWSQIECTETPESVRVAYKLTIPEIVKELSYPYDLAMTQTYEIGPNTISMTTNITNNADKPAPFAFGYHPYFALPDTNRQGVILSLPSSSLVSLDPILLVPTGDTEPTPAEFELEPGFDYDCVYCDLTGTRATLNIGQLGRRIHIYFEDDIENLVIYAGSGTPAVCVEPWTKGLAAYSKLSKEGWEESGVINVIQPGEERVLRVKYTVEDSLIVTR